MLDATWASMTILNTVGYSESTITDFSRELNNVNSKRPAAQRGGCGRCRPRHGLHGRADLRAAAALRPCDSAGDCDGAANDAGKSWATRARGPGSNAAAAAASGGANGRTRGRTRAYAHVFVRAAHVTSRRRPRRATETSAMVPMAAATTPET